MGLKIGTHDYFGETINTVPIRTTSALCYKVESTSKFDRATSLIINVVDLNRKKPKEKDNFLESIQMYVTASNTWQGVIYGT